MRELQRVFPATAINYDSLSFRSFNLTNQERSNSSNPLNCERLPQQVEYII